MGYVIVSWRVFPKPKQPSCQPQEEMKDEDAELEPWEDSEVFEALGLTAGAPPVGSQWDLFVPYFQWQFVHKCVWFVVCL